MKERRPNHNSSKELAADYATLYHSLGAIMALVAWVYGLTCSFLLGAEFIAQPTPGPPGHEPGPRRSP